VPASSETGRKSPWGCRLRSRREVYDMVHNWVMQFCADPNLPDNERQTNFQQFAADNSLIADIVDRQIEHLALNLLDALDDECTKLDGRFVPAFDDTLWCRGADNGGMANHDPRAEEAPLCPTGERQTQWLHDVFGGRPVTSWGMCFRHAEFDACAEVEQRTGGKGLARWNAAANRCEYQPGIWKVLCELAEGSRAVWVPATNSCYLFPTTTGGSDDE